MSLFVSFAYLHYGEHLHIILLVEICVFGGFIYVFCSVSILYILVSKAVLTDRSNCPLFPSVIVEVYKKRGLACKIIIKKWRKLGEPFVPHGASIDRPHLIRYSLTIFVFFFSFSGSSLTSSMIRSLVCFLGDSGSDNASSKVWLFSCYEKIISSWYAT